MGRPPKPFAVIKAEKKSHRTKKELKQREEGEKALLTGKVMKESDEVKNSPVAHKEFARLKKLLKKINHDDALYESVINRYCLLQAECEQITETINKLNHDIEEVENKRADGTITDFMDYIGRKQDIYNLIIAWDKKRMDKRKMLLQIERENVMTILAALKAVPRKPEDKSKNSPMAAFLKREGGVNAT